MEKTQSIKGFTLIELLIVIAIVAILSVVVVLTLNPAELLRQSRDSNRVSDMATLRSAVSLYLADVNSPSLARGYTNCYASVSSTVGMGTDCFGRFSTSAASTSTTSRAVDGTTGWLPVNFNQISSGAPIGNLPIDPVNDATYFYAYMASSTNLIFEINANMESSRYANTGSGDVESTDGGSNTGHYEVGTAPGLAL